MKKHTGVLLLSVLLLMLLLSACGTGPDTDDTDASADEDQPAVEEIGLEALLADSISEEGDFTDEFGTVWHWRRSRRRSPAARKQTCLPIRSEAYSKRSAQ